MKLSKISLCYYPTTVVLIDDNKVFLQALSSKLTKYLSISSYALSQNALDFFSEQYRSYSFIDRCVEKSSEGNLDQLTQNIDIRDIQKEIFNPKRFAEISVIVVDYAMPNINGLDFSRALKNKHPRIKIIMLTGEADHALAIEAFNEGIIEKFIMKSSQNLAELLLQSIHELQTEYFFQLSENYLANANQFSNTLTCLTDPVFIDFFQKLCEKEKIIEYYLTDSYGSFLLLDNQAQPQWLAVKSENDMEAFLQLAEMGEASETVIDALKAKEKIPFFQTEQDLQAPTSQWDKYMYPATKLNGSNNYYYYTYISNSNTNNIDQHKVVSYQEYLATIS